MIEISGRRVERTLVALLLFACGLFAASARAVRVDDLYSASVPLADGSAEATRAAFGEALRKVLVKVTGQAGAGEDPGVMNQFGDPEAMVQQFRRNGAGSLWAQFDSVALRRRLEGAGLPVWGQDRPATMVWLAYDTGGGERDVLASGGTDTPVAADLRRGLLGAAEARGVPIVLPLRDSEDLAAVTYADLWGEFTAPVVKASARYQADAILIGRARLFPAGMTDVRWTLLLRDERLEWRGDIAAGPGGLADRLAQRLAWHGSGDAKVVRFEVTGVRTLDDYGLLLAYLRNLGVIESLQVGYVAADTMIFDLKLRGDRALLVRSLAIGRVVVPTSGSPSGQTVTLAGGPPPDLTYRLNSAR